MIHPGSQELLISQTTTGSGTTAKDGVIQSDSILCTLWVDSVTSGQLDVSVYTLTDTGKEVLILSFPTISAPTANLLLKDGGVSMQRFRVVATYTGICTYEIYGRAVSGLGASNSCTPPDVVTTATSTLTTTATELHTGLSRNPDRQLVRVYNDSTATVYIGPSTVTSSGSTKGEPLQPGESITYTLGDTGLYGVVGSGSASVIITELA